MYIGKTYNVFINSSRNVTFRGKKNDNNFKNTDIKSFQRFLSTATLRSDSKAIDRSSNFPPHYWEDVSNHRKFIEWATKQLNIKDLNDWYKIKVKVLMIRITF
jgi:hypothetical protein